MAIPTDAHLLAFGRIMHHYALCETGIKITVSAILNIPVSEAVIVLEPGGATDLKNVAKSLAKAKLKPAFAETFCCIVGDWGGYNSLRNLIAHSAWTDGVRPGSIKPRRVSIREGRALFTGDEEDEKDYTAPELEKAAREIALINYRNAKFLDESGLQRIIDKYIDEASAETSDASGNDTKQSDK